jgi:hypothetical protein
MGALLFDETNDNVKSTSLSAALSNLTDGGALTMLWVTKLGAGDNTFEALGYLLSGTGSGTVQFGLSVNNTEDWLIDVGASQTVVGTFENAIYMVAITSTGSGNTPRVHYKVGSAGAWTHANFGGTVTHATVATMLEIGMWQGSDPFGGHIGIFSAWEGAMSDTEIEACDNNWRTSDLYNHAFGTPKSLIELNTTTPTDLAGGASSLTVSGATVSAETLDSWNFNGTGGGAHTLSLGIVSETDSGLALTISKPIVKALGIVSEADTALALSMVNQALTANLGIASEADSPLGLTILKPQTLVLGLAEEVDSGLTLTIASGGGSITIPLGIASETDSPLGMSFLKTVALGQASDTEEAFGITIVNQALAVALGIASETDSALALTLIAPKTIALGIAEEIDTALGASVVSVSPSPGDSGRIVLHIRFGPYN